MLNLFACITLCVSLTLGAHDSLRVISGRQPDAVGSATGAADSVGAGAAATADSVAATVPKVPEAPLPAMGSPVAVPVVGSQQPHTANPAVCGILGGVIVLNWLLACCCAAGGAAAAGDAAAEAEAGDTASAGKAGAAGGVAGALFACVECTASICSIIALVYVCYTGLVQALLGGQAISGWCLALAIIGTLQLAACVCICCCASCGAAILGPAAYKKYVVSSSKHVMGGHLHDMVQRHKPDGTHPITEGHLPLVGHPTGRQGRDQATEQTPLRVAGNQ